MNIAKPVVLSLFAASALSGIIPSSSSAQDHGPEESERYVITTVPGEHPGNVAAAHGLSPRHVFSHVLNGFAAHVPPGRLKALADDPRVSNVVIDHPVFSFARKPKQPPTSTGTQIVPAGVTRVGARAVAQTGAGVGVAILDSGLDLRHADLPISPYSFVSPGFSYYTRSAQDDGGHGTHVGGIVAAKNNDRDVVGVAPGATLYAVKILDNNGSGYDSDIAAGLDWVTKNANAVSPRIRVINMSLGRPASADDSIMRQAVANAVAAGITVVTAAGNDPTMEVSQTVPAGFPEVIAVASTTAKAGTSSTSAYAPIPADTASYFSTDGLFNPQTGVGVAISAPGEDQENIVYPNLESVGILSTALGGGTTRMNGTSMAAPHVAGVVALLLEKAPALTPAQVKARIMTGEKEGTAPLNSPTSSYSFDGEREGILSAAGVVNF